MPTIGRFASVVLRVVVKQYSSEPRLAGIEVGIHLGIAQAQLVLKVDWEVGVVNQSGHRAQSRSHAEGNQAGIGLRVRKGR